jgi:hypothetical protein
MADPIQRNLDPKKRLLNLIRGRDDITRPDVTTKSTKSISGVATHEALVDMPSSTNEDHDGRYYTETEIGSTSNGEGASLVGIEDAGTYFTGTDVEAALQEIGSDLAGATSYWDRTGTVLSPATAGDTVEIDQTSTTGNALKVIRDLASGSTNDAVVEFAQINAGDDQAALAISNASTSAFMPGALRVLASGATGNGVGTWSTTGGGDADSVAVLAEAQAVTANATYGVWGTTASTANDGYGGRFDKASVGDYADFDESADSPLAAAPEAGHVRAVAGSDGRLYAIDSDGNRHDLTQRTPHYFAGWTAAQNATKDKTWDSDAYNSGLGSEATVTASQAASFDFTNQAAEASYGRWTWTASALVMMEEPLTILYEQSQVAVWTPFGRQGDPNDNCRCYVQARMRVNRTTSFENVYLFLNDVTTADADSSNALSSDMLGSMSDNTWYIATLSATGTDVGGWNESLRAGVLAQGKLYEEEAEEETTVIDIDWIKVYMYGD